MVEKYNVKVQYAAWIAVATLGTVVVMTLGHLLRDMSSRDAAARQRAELLARAVADTAEPAVLATNKPALVTMVKNIVHDDEVLYIRVLNAEGTPGLPPERERARMWSWSPCRESPGTTSGRRTHPFSTG